MLVDDVAVERRLMRRVLERTGRFEVTAEAGSGREAVNLVGGVAPDLVLLDLSMPGMDGLEALPLLLDASPGSKVVVLSGFSAEQAAQPALRAGAHGYLEKGLHPDEIVAYVTELLGGPGAPAAPSTPVGALEFSAVLHAASAELFLDPSLLNQQILDALQEGVVVLDQNGLMRAANRSAYRTLGLQRDEATGRPGNGDWVAIDEQGVALAPGEHPSMVALRTGEPQLSVTIGIERPSGERCWMMVNTVPLRPSGSTVVQGVVSSFIEVTEQVRLAAALRDNEELLRQAQEHSSIGMALVSLDGTWLSINPALCRIVGRTNEELLRMRAQEIVHPDDRETGRDDARRLLAGEIDSNTAEKRYLHADGHVVWVQVDASLVRDADGEPRHLVAQVQDITERKRSQELLELQHEELARSNADLERFAYVASHDLSEPLRVISGFVSLLETELDASSGGVIHEYLRYVSEGTARMHTLIRDLLAFSRVGRTGEACQPTDLGEIFADAGALLGPAIAEAGATLDVGPLPVIPAHRALMRQLAQNLLANAVKFRRPDRAPCIEVRADRGPPGRWTLRVEDNGIGIAPEDRERVFEVFERLHSRDDYAGTGIGLAICQRIVECHGGTIAAEGSTLGGTAIVVTLPELQEA
jgi:PAS domain S-box-containing protein